VVQSPLITIITPSVGRPSLRRLMKSLDEQPVPFCHIILFDGFRVEGAEDPSAYCVAPSHGIRYTITIPGNFVKPPTAGAALRSIGIMAADTPWVAFQDDDCWIENNHYTALLAAVEGKHWGFSRRKVWHPNGTLIGKDDFESIGVGNKLGYDLVDGNTYLIRREYATAMAVQYRETKSYNDDRLALAFLTQHGGPPGTSNAHTVNQVCPDKLIGMFEAHCTRELV
jgi:hypothetical protein